MGGKGLAAKVSGADAWQKVKAGNVHGPTLRQDIFQKALSVRHLKDKKQKCILLKFYSNKQHSSYGTISLPLAHLELQYIISEHSWHFM